MQESAIPEGHLEQNEDRDVQSELSSQESMLRKRRDQMRSLHITRQRQVTTEMLEVLKKRREKVIKIICKSRDIGNSDEKIIPRMRNIQRLTLLTRIHIDFEYSDVTDKGISSISDCLRQHFTSLKSIYLCFGCCENITPTGLSSLTDSLRHMTLLNRVSLDFRSSPMSFLHVTDAVIISISDSLRHLPSLNRVSLIFQGDQRITDGGMISFSAKLRRLTRIASLKSVALIFSHCKGITETGFKSVTDSLRYLTLLAYVFISLSGCSKVSKQAKELAKKDLKELPFLKYLEIF